MDENIRKKHLELLRDKNESLLTRLRSAVKLELDYWDQRTDPPNLSEAEFKLILGNIGSYEHKYEVRKSTKGKYGATGEKSVFYITFSLAVGRFINSYMIKGFFFEEGNLKGVCVQSFRQERRISRGKLRIV